MTGIDNSFTARIRSVLGLYSMHCSNEDVLHGGLNPGESRTLSRLDDVGEDVRLRSRFVDLADEDVDAAEGDLVPVFD